VTITDKILHGGDYNPEQWIDVPGTWDEDLRLMKLAGVNAATIGIFSWAMLEQPR
jgi:beta-galactosidase